MTEITFKDLRKKSGYTTDYIAQKLGIKVTTYRKYECFVRIPSSDILSKMHSLYKCNADELLDALNYSKEVRLKRYGKSSS